jgi:hypothetical protein
MTAGISRTAKAGRWLPVVESTSATSSGPATDPAWSMASWIPYPRPCPTSEEAKESMASRGGFLRPLPARSAMKSRAATSQRPARARAAAAGVVRRAFMVGVLPEVWSVRAHLPFTLSPRYDTGRTLR